MMAQPFRFSHRPNRAADINWRIWGADAFAEAGRSDKPILLCITAIWCQWCHQMDETTYSAPDLIQFINHNFIPIRVDADQSPHVQDRYVAGGWPTNAFLTPTGEVLWAGTTIDPDQFKMVGEGVVNAWLERRAELGAEVERRRKALEAARARVNTVGLVRREAADDVWTSIADSFDARNGGFGAAPKYPMPDAVELLFMRGGEEKADPHIAVHTLEGMVAGELWDHVDGGFFRYALAEDWTQPQFEKLLAVNAGLLRAYALGARVHERADWREVAERIVAWADQWMRRDDGLWAASQASLPEYYRAAADERGAHEPPRVDPVLYTSANAQWIRALADAGSRLGRTDWIAAAAGALQLLLQRLTAPNGLFYHYCEPECEPQLSSLLLDAAEVARACVSVAQATGDAELLVRARTIVGAIEKAFWANEGGFYDRTRTSQDVGVLRYRDRPFEQNADLARLLIDLALAVGERSYRALAERTIALLSPLAGRYGAAGASFAMAVHEFFGPPLQIFIVGSGPEAARLRDAALALPIADRRVWPLPRGGRVGTEQFTVHDRPAAYIVGLHGVSAPIFETAGLAEAVAAVT